MVKLNPHSLFIFASVCDYFLQLTALIQRVGITFEPKTLLAHL